MKVESWLNGIAPNRGNLLSEDSWIRSFEHGLFMNFKSIGFYFIHRDGSISGLKAPQATKKLFTTYREASIKPFSRVFQGHLVIHGGAVTIGERTVSFIGDSGVGKSTMTYAFIEHGAKIITESGLVFPDMGTTFIKADPFLKLYGDYSAILGDGDRIDPEAEKFIYTCPEQAEGSRFQLDITIVLGWGSSAAIVAVENRAQRFAYLHQNAIAKNISQRLFPEKLTNSIWNLSSNPLYLFTRPRTFSIEQSFTALKQCLDK